MAETPNCKFYVSSDNQEDFLDWRDKIAGQIDSNFHKADAAITKLSADMPTKTSQLQNDSGYTTMSQVKQAFKDAIRESLEASY